LAQSGVPNQWCISFSNGATHGRWREGGGDAAWISLEREEASNDPDLFSDLAPEICVEVNSPGNTPAEMLEKKMLYFAAGAEEVWFREKGRMSFFLKAAPTDEGKSARCPDFPDHFGF